MGNRLKGFMSTMGTGPESSDSLSYEAAREAMEALLEGDFEPATFGGFAVAERWKSESVDELAGFLDELRGTDLRPLAPDASGFLDVAGRFDGKLKGVNVALPAALLNAAAGLPVLMHSGREVPTKAGTTFLDVLEELGWDPRPEPSTTTEGLETGGFGYTAQSVYAPGLESLRSLRDALGVRTFFNTIESMLNPADASLHVGSFYHLPFANRVADVFEASRTTAPDRVVMIQGMEGQPELRPGASWVVIRGDREEERELRAASLGLPYEREALEAIGADPAGAARLLERLLKGEEVPDDYRNAVLMTAAAWHWAAGRDDTPSDAAARLRDVLEAERAVDLFGRLGEVYGRERKTVSDSV